MSTSLARATLLLALLVLAACAPTRQQVRQARQVVATQVEQAVDCRQPDHCARASLLYDLGRDGDPQGRRNHAILLELGEDALIARLNLIRAAHRSISVQVFIWADDDAGKLVMDALVRAARRGVKVRILVDQLGAFNNLGLLTRLARTHANLDLRLYNPTLHSAVTGPLGLLVGGLCCFSSINQRMHNKLLVVDGRVGITGGRNYANEYFDWDGNFAFIDRDILVAGPVAQQMLASFTRFWRHPRSVPLLELQDVIKRVLGAPADAPGWLAPRYQRPARVNRVLAQARDRHYIRQHFELRAHMLEHARYYSDLPGKTRDDDPDERALTARLMHLLASAEHEIVLQTPYLIISDHAQQLFRKLARKRPRVRVLVSTNSLASTDAFYTWAVSHKYVRRYLEDFNFTLYELKPHPVDAPRMLAHFHELSGPVVASASDANGDQVPLTTPGVRISLHAKSLVVDGEVVMIGSHNFDPRSNNYNTEAGIIIRDADFAAIVRASILASTRPGNAWVVAKRPVDGVLAYVNRTLATLSSYLPIFDLWPFGYATSWQLKRGCSPMYPDHPRFYQCYVSAGEFPEVALPLKTIYARIFTAFGGANFKGVL